MVRKPEFIKILNVTLLYTICIATVETLLIKDLLNIVIHLRNRS